MTGCESGPGFPPLPGFSIGGELDHRAQAVNVVLAPAVPGADVLGEHLELQVDRIAPRQRRQLVEETLDDEDVGRVFYRAPLPARAAPYGASKSGLAGLTRTLATEWAPRGIRVNGIGPGYFRTALTESFYEDQVGKSSQELSRAFRFHHSCEIQNITHQREWPG